MATTNENGTFAGKAAFVTDAATGIGRAAALAFAREGASVVVGDVSERGNQETARMIEELGGRALAVRCDVTRTDDVRAALNKAIEAFEHQFIDLGERLTSDHPLYDPTSVRSICCLPTVKPAVAVVSGDSEVSTI